MDRGWITGQVVHTRPAPGVLSTRTVKLATFPALITCPFGVLTICRLGVVTTEIDPPVAVAESPVVAPCILAWARLTVVRVLGVPGVESTGALLTDRLSWMLQ